MNSTLHVILTGGGGYVVKIGEGHCHVPIVQQVDMLDPNVNVDHENALIQ